MPISQEELAQRSKRRAWWLGVARRTRGLSQAGVAKALGLSPKSASTIGDWERGVSEPSLKMLAQLAAIYDAPLSLFMEPPLTDEERFTELARAAEVLERQDWEEQQAQPRAAAGGRAGARSRAS